MDCVLECAMETPSSIRRLTRSQAAAVEEKKSGMSALLDITNDSPIVGLTAACQKTPASSAVKNSGFRAKRTPGSGEALLRGQVKTLLQRVEEEEAELVNKRRPFREPRLSYPAILAGLARSPAQLLAPTPANTPQLPNSSFWLGEEHVAAQLEEPKIKVAAAVVCREEVMTPQECLISRALLFDSPRKSEASSWDDKSQSWQKSPAEDESSSVWSIQANQQVEESEAGKEDVFDDLCEGLRKMSVVDDKLRLPKFTSKHTRFAYSDDEMMIQREEEEDECKVVVSPSALLLKGLPAPEGKHLGFQEDGDDDQL